MNAILQLHIAICFNEFAALLQEFLTDLEMKYCRVMARLNYFYLLHLLLKNSKNPLSL